MRAVMAGPGSVSQVYELFGPETLELARIVRMVAAAAGLRRWVIPLPDALGIVQARIGELLPGKPISLDNFRSLALDSVGQKDGLSMLGIVPRTFSSELPHLLHGHHGRTALLDAARKLGGLAAEDRARLS